MGFRRQHAVVASIVLSICACSPALYAQEPIDFDAFSKAPSVAVEGVSSDLQKERTAAQVHQLRKYQEELTNRIAYQDASLDHVNRVLAWQLQSSKIIFFITILIVISGLYMSHQHFLRGDDSSTRFAIGQKGIEVSSRLIGLVVLIVSLAFFYLYLKEVYPVKVLNASSATQETDG